MFYFHNEAKNQSSMFGESLKKEDEGDLIETSPKPKELPIIQIFGFDGTVEIWRFFNQF